MADNALSSLYPQPTKPNEGLLSGDPSKLLGIVGQINQNALFNQTFNAKRAIGRAYQNAIQDDGSIHTPTLMREIKKDPDAAFMAGDAAAGALTREGQQISNTTAHFDQAVKQNNFVVDGLGILADKPNVTLDDVRHFAVTAARNTKIPSAMLNAWVSQLPRDPKALKESLVTMRNMAIGSSGLSNNGIPQVVTEGPNTGAVVTPSRGQSNYNVAGSGGSVMPGVQTALPPGVVGAKETAGQASGAGLSRAREEAIDYQRQVFPLEQAIPALEKLGTTGTGPGTETVNHLKSFVQSMVPGADFKGIKDNVEAYDKAKKYLTDFVNQTGNSGTNDKLAAAFAGNPSVNISNAAATDVAKAALSLRRMKQAQLLAFENSGLPESDYAKFAGKWNTSHDPRAYGFDLMSVDQRRKVLESLPENKRDLLKMDVQDAVTNNLFRMPITKK